MAKKGERPTSWSFSRWDQWRKCPFKYKRMFIDKATKVQTEAMARGNRVHLDLAKFLKGEAAEMPAAVKSPYHQQIYNMTRAFPNKLIEEQWGFNNKWKPTGYFAGDIWLRSILDVALFYDDNTLEAIDHKTGKQYGSNDDQMELFALATFCRVPAAKQVTTRLVYVDLGDKEEYGDFYAKDKEALKAKWEGLVAPMFNDYTFPQRPNDKCKWCEFGQSDKGDKTCRFG